MKVNKEHPPTEKEINDYIENQKGITGKQKEILIEKSKEIWFRQYVKDSNLLLKKLTKTVKKQIKQYYNKKGGREDKRGQLPEKKIKKGVTKKEIKDKVEESQKLTRAEKELIKLNYSRAPSGRQYDGTEIHEGKGSKRARAWRIKNNIPVNDYYDRYGKTTYKIKE